MQQSRCCIISVDGFAIYMFGLCSWCIVFVYVDSLAFLYCLLIFAVFCPSFGVLRSFYYLLQMREAQ